jgi:hypothetical protein
VEDTAKTLQLHGLIAREMSQNSPDWFFVTERGGDVVENDAVLPRIAAAERQRVRIKQIPCRQLRDPNASAARDCVARI